MKHFGISDWIEGYQDENLLILAKHGKYERSLNHLIPNLTYCSSDFRNPCRIKTKRASYLDGWIKDGGCMMRSHVRTGCVSWCCSSDPDHVTRAISAHCSSSNIGQCQARPVGSPTVSPHTFSGLSHNTHYKTSGEIKKSKGRRFISRSIVGLPVLAAKLRHLAASGEPGVASSSAVWGHHIIGRRRSGAGVTGARRIRRIRSHETRGWQGPGAVRGWGLVSGPEPGSGLSHHRSRSQWPGARDPGPGLASPPVPSLCFLHQSARTQNILDFSLKYVLKFLSLKGYLRLYIIHLNM